MITAYTSLFIASKNQEVEPLSINDIAQHFLMNEFANKKILKKEYLIRKALNYQNEISTLFDFILYYIKVWGLGCRKQFEKEEVKQYGIITKFIN